MAPKARSPASNITTDSSAGWESDLEPPRLTASERALLQEARDAAYARRLQRSEEAQPPQSSTSSRSSAPRASTARPTATGSQHPLPGRAPARPSSATSWEPDVAAAAAELNAATGGPKGNASPSAKGPLPPAPSSTGRAWYAVGAHLPGGPCIAAGQKAALRLLGGSWLGQGQAPTGFSSFDQAYNWLHSKHPERPSFEVYWR